MTFTLSKVFWLLVKPSNVLMFVLLFAVVAYLSGKRRLARILFGVATCGLLLITFLPVGNWAITPLDNRFPQQLPEDVDGIIILSGSVNPTYTLSRGTVSFTAAAERYIVALELARRYPKAQLVITGGDTRAGQPLGDGESLIERLLVDLGLDRSRLVIEGDSVNTYENAVFSKRLIQPRPDQSWLLITSAHHMPRAVGVFRHAGWTIHPYPVDYNSIGTYGLGFHLFITAGGRLAKLDAAMKEWTGLLIYWLLGRTGTLFPGPETPSSHLANDPSVEQNAR
ncbi:MAG: YdcF family protein [Hyphomicrobiales bacterium]|nr:YdcF family protein [Hyphomicrobiales bacterium]